ncbi:MAG: BrnT family toxin [Treponema sp.]|nr:BrnT family toxin [Treponema sp.]
MDLETVNRVFDDPFHIEKYDESHSGAEDRWQVLGKSGDVLFVVYMERGTKTRIITAREAEPEERRIYYGEGGKESWFIP